MNDFPAHLEEKFVLEPEQQTLLDPRAEQRWRRTARLLGLGTVVGLSLLVGFGAWQHANRAAATVATLEAARAAVPVVHVAIVKAEDTPLQIDLPGTIQAFDSATLYARATGYIGKRNVDIGSPVHRQEPEPRAVMVRVHTNSRAYGVDPNHAIHGRG